MFNLRLKAINFTLYKIQYGVKNSDDIFRQQQQLQIVFFNDLMYVKFHFSYYKTIH